MARLPMKWRWLASVAGTLLLASSIDCGAGQVLLQGVTGNTCTYSGITVDANGGMVVACTGSPAPDQSAGTFNIVSNGFALTWNTTSNTTFTITRSNGSTGGVTVSFTRSGGCGPSPLQDTAAFANGVTSLNVPVATPNNSTTCKFTLTGVTATDATATSPPVLGTDTVATVPVNWIPVGGCPAPANAVPVQINAFGVDRVTLASGKIGYMTLPSNVSSLLGTTTKSAKVVIADATTSPSAATREVWISHCPGVYDASVLNPPGRCFASDTDGGAVLALNWFQGPGADPSATDAMATAYNICEAYASKGPWYVNVRWTYPDSNCPWGVGMCGYVAQFNFSALSP